MENKVNAFIRVIIAGATILLVPIGAAADMLVVGKDAFAVNITGGSKSATKRFNKSQTELMEYNITPRYMAAFLADQASASTEVDLSNSKHGNAAAYGAATTYKLGAGGVLDKSGLSHLGLNLLLGMDASNKKAYFLNTLDSYNSGRLYIAKIFKVDSVELALESGIDELRTSGFENVCGLGWRSEEGSYVPGNYIAVPAKCSKVRSQPMLTARSIEHYNVLRGVVDKGFEVSVSVWAKGSTPDELEIRKGYLDVLKAGMPHDWFVMAADLSEGNPPKTFVVWKDGVERRYPLPNR